MKYIVNGDFNSIKGITFVRNTIVPRKPKEGVFLTEKERRKGGFFPHVITMNCAGRESNGSQSVGHGTAAAAPESSLARTTLRPHTRAME